MHYHLTESQIFIGGFALILVIVFVLAALFEDRRKKTGPFRNYFASEYDRDLHQRSWREDDDGLTHRHSRFAPVHRRGLDTYERRIGVSGTTQRDRERS